MTIRYNTEKNKHCVITKQGGQQDIEIGAGYES